MDQIPADDGPAPESSKTDTPSRLLRTAERLFAEHGIAGTSTRRIVREAGQRNESALHYHFGSREGLIESLYRERGAQVGTERRRMLDELDELDDEDGAESTVRRLCEIAFLPALRVARRDPSFVYFLRVVGQLAFLPSPRLRETILDYEGETVRELHRRLRSLVELPIELVEHRVDVLQRLAALSLAQRAMAREPFDGPEADLYFANLVDALAAMLEAAPSDRTGHHLESVRRLDASTRRQSTKDGS